jgi:hypothetical protein
VLRVLAAALPTGQPAATQQLKAGLLAIDRKGWSTETLLGVSRAELGNAEEREAHALKQELMRAKVAAATNDPKVAAAVRAREARAEMLKGRQVRAGLRKPSLQQGMGLPVLPAIKRQKAARNAGPLTPLRVCAKNPELGADEEEEEEEKLPAFVRQEDLHAVTKAVQEHLIKASKASSRRRDKHRPAEASVGDRDEDKGPGSAGAETVHLVFMQWVLVSGFAEEAPPVPSPGDNPVERQASRQAYDELMAARHPQLVALHRAAGAATPGTLFCFRHPGHTDREHGGRGRGDGDADRAVQVELAAIFPLTALLGVSTTSTNLRIDEKKQKELAKEEAVLRFKPGSGQLDKNDANGEAAGRGSAKKAKALKARKPALKRPVRELNFTFSPNRGRTAMKFVRAVCSDVALRGMGGSTRRRRVGVERVEL